MYEYSQHGWRSAANGSAFGMYPIHREHRTNLSKLRTLDIGKVVGIFVNLVSCAKVP